jgi:hypothetical protein
LFSAGRVSFFGDDGQPMFAAVADPMVDDDGHAAPVAI